MLFSGQGTFADLNVLLKAERIKSVQSIDVNKQQQNVWLKSYTREVFSDRTILYTRQNKGSSQFT